MPVHHRHHRQQRQLSTNWSENWQNMNDQINWHFLPNYRWNSTSTTTPKLILDAIQWKINLFLIHVGNWPQTKAKSSKTTSWFLAKLSLRNTHIRSLRSSSNTNGCCLDCDCDSTASSFLNSTSGTSLIKNQPTGSLWMAPKSRQIHCIRWKKTTRSCLANSKTSPILNFNTSSAGRQSNSDNLSVHALLRHKRHRRLRERVNYLWRRVWIRAPQRPVMVAAVKTVRICHLILLHLSHIL